MLFIALVIAMFARLFFREQVEILMRLDFDSILPKSNSTVYVQTDSQFKSIMKSIERKVISEWMDLVKYRFETNPQFEASIISSMMSDFWDEGKFTVTRWDKLSRTNYTMKDYESVLSMGYQSASEYSHEGIILLFMFV